MITEYFILGERCTGTNYLEELMTANFNLKKAQMGTSKHFFGFNNLEKLKRKKHVLFIGIVRNPVDWLNSLYKRKHHLPDHITKSVPSFLNSKWYSIYDNPANKEKEGKEILQDRNIYTNERYVNVFEMRHVKHKYLIDELPSIVENYILIKYEDLVNDFNTVMNNIKNKGISLKKNINFPINITWNCKDKKKKSEFKPEIADVKLIPDDKVYSHKTFNVYYEKILGYVN